MARAPMMRDRDWSPEAKADAIERIVASVASGMSVTRTLQMLEGMPTPGLFWGTWHFESEDVQAKVARAREAGVEVILEEARDIADHPQEGEEIVEMASDEDDEGTVIKRTKKDMLGHRKLQIETRIKYAQMIAPRKYGPKLDLTTDNKPISSDIADVAARAASLLELAKKRKGEDDG